MLELTIGEVGSLLGHAWWPFCRLMGLFLSLPMLASAYVSIRVKVLLGMLIALVLAPLVPSPPAIDMLSISAVLLAAEQVLFGMMIGFPLTMMIHALSTLGGIISMQMGLAMAMMNDPVNGGSQPILGQWTMMLGILLFLSIDGHLVALEVLAQSFTLWPVGTGLLDFPFLDLLTQFSWMLTAALTLALPAVITLLLVNITFGVLNRAAQNFNIFALGFPLAMLVGLFAFSQLVKGLPALYLEYCDQALNFMLRLSTRP